MRHRAGHGHHQPGQQGLVRPLLNAIEENARRGVTTPFWNVLSVALPVAALGLGVLLLAANPAGRGDFAGAMGGAVLFVFGVGGACALGAIAAVIALARGERKMWLSWIGLVGNGAVLLPLVVLLLRD